MKPYLRVANVFENRFDYDDIKEMHFSPKEFEYYTLRSDDILLNEGQSPELLGRPALYNGEPDRYAFTNSLIRFRAGPAVLPSWALLVFRHYMHSGRFAREVRITTNIAHLSAGRFKAIEFPVPPLAEQRRIVAQFETLSSSIESAEQRLEQASHKVIELRTARIQRLVGDLPRRRLADLITETRYGTSAKCSYEPSDTPVLRIPNIISGRVNLSDLKFAPPGSVAKLQGLELAVDDLLVVRTNGSRDLIGRSALAGAAAGMSFASYLIRCRLDKTVVAPRWAAIAFDFPDTRAQVEMLAASSAGQYNLSTHKLLRVEIPVPRTNDQQQLIDRSEEESEDVRRLALAIDRAREQAATVATSVLKEAVDGKGTSHVERDELAPPASRRDRRP